MDLIRFKIKFYFETKFMLKYILKCILFTTMKVDSFLKLLFGILYFALNVTWFLFMVFHVLFLNDQLTDFKLQFESPLPHMQLWKVLSTNKKKIQIFLPVTRIYECMCLQECIWMYTQTLYLYIHTLTRNILFFVLYLFQSVSWYRFDQKLVVHFNSARRRWILIVARFFSRMKGTFNPEIPNQNKTFQQFADQFALFSQPFSVRHAYTPVFGISTWKFSSLIAPGMLP